MDDEIATLLEVFPDVDLEAIARVLKEEGGNVNGAAQRLMRMDREQGSRQSTLHAFLTTSAKRPLQPPPESVKKRARNAVVTLLTLQDIRAHVPCTLELDVLPKDLSDRLWTVLREASTDWSPHEFWLFDRLVTSPHTSASYVTPSLQHIDTTYNGRKTTKRLFTPEMTQAAQIIEERVNYHLNQRPRHPLQVQGIWHSNALVANAYNGGKESVGYHSDRLTYIGPLPTIASVTLGVTRPFYLKPIQPTGTIYSIPLPHNSLLIMHPPCQEEFQHCVPPLPTLSPHGVYGSLRLNVTFRMWRMGEYDSKKCKCGVECVFRRLKKGGYAWMCQSTYVDGGQGCGYFEQLSE